MIHAFCRLGGALVSITADTDSVKGMQGRQRVVVPRSFGVMCSWSRTFHNPRMAGAIWMPLLIGARLPSSGSVSLLYGLESYRENYMANKSRYCTNRETTVWRMQEHGQTRENV